MEIKKEREEADSLDHYVKYLKEQGFGGVNDRAKSMLNVNNSAKNVAGEHTDSVPAFHTGGITLSDVFKNNKA